MIINLFWLHPNPVINAQQHLDKHVVKMPLEVAQQLSCAHHEHSSPVADDVYKPTHKHHPCTRWICASADAYAQGYKMFQCLLAEYTYRYGKQHGCSKLLSSLAHNPCPNVPAGPKPQAMPDEYKHDDVFTAYRTYYKNDKAYIANWSMRPLPDWWDKL